MEQATEKSFYQDVIKASYVQPVLVQFWAPWCGPCHGLSDTIDRIASSYEYPVKYIGLDVDQYTNVALQYKIMGVPHTKIFVSGIEIDKFSDPMAGHEVILFLKNALVLPYILKYSHYHGGMDHSYIHDLEDSASLSSRKNTYYVTLAKHYFFSDIVKSMDFLNKIPDESDQFEDRLYLKDLYPLMDVEFNNDPVMRKLWSARNVLKQQDYESTYQFLLQANRIGFSSDHSDIARITLLAFRHFLGHDHELNRKYEPQFSQVL